MPTKIEWTDESWNPVVGCTKVSAGCQNCYAEKMMYRQVVMGYARHEKNPDGNEDAWEAYSSVMDEDTHKWNGSVALRPEILDKPLHWHEPRRIFVCSMGDLFHEKVPFEYIKRIWDIAVKCPQHILQFLTKRPNRQLEFTQWMAGQDDISIAEWPRNCWLGVSVENQKAADERIPILLQIPAAVRFVSLEPLLEKIEIEKYLHTRELRCVGCGNVFWAHDADWCDGHRLYDCGCRSIGDPTCSCVYDNEYTLACPKCGECACKLKKMWKRQDRITQTKGGRFDWLLDAEKWKNVNWVIIGCESLPGGRAGRFCEDEDKWWQAARDIKDQCIAADVKFFMKQGPINGKVSHKPSEWPEDLRIRE